MCMSVVGRCAFFIIRTIPIWFLFQWLSECKISKFAGKLKVKCLPVARVEPVRCQTVRAYPMWGDCDVSHSTSFPCSEMIVECPTMLSNSRMWTSCLTTSCVSSFVEESNWESCWDLRWSDLVSTFAINHFYLCIFQKLTNFIFHLNILIVVVIFHRLVSLMLRAIVERRLLLDDGVYMMRTACRDRCRRGGGRWACGQFLLIHGWQRWAGRRGFTRGRRWAKVFIIESLMLYWQLENFVLHWRRWHWCRWRRWRVQSNTFWITILLLQCCILIGHFC